MHDANNESQITHTQKKYLYVSRWAAAPGTCLEVTGREWSSKATISPWLTAFQQR